VSSAILRSLTEAGGGRTVLAREGARPRLSAAGTALGPCLTWVATHHEPEPSAPLHRECGRTRLARPGG